MLDDKVDEFVAEILAKMGLQVLDPWVNLHTVDDAWDGVGWEYDTLNLGYGERMKCSRGMPYVWMTWSWRRRHGP